MKSVSPLTAQITKQLGKEKVIPGCAVKLKIYETLRASSTRFVKKIMAPDGLKEFFNVAFECPPS